MPRRIICVSHASGSGGEEVARLVAEQLGLRYLDDQILLRAAADGSVRPELVIDAERRKPVFERLLSPLRGSAVDVGRTDDDDLERGRRLIRDAIHGAAGEGDVVIVAHAASYALGPRPDVLRVLVTAPASTRARRLEGGERALRTEDAGRAAYLKRFYDVPGERPDHYDLVVSTESLTPAEAAAVVVGAAS